MNQKNNNINNSGNNTTQANNINNVNNSNSISNNQNANVSQTPSSNSNVIPNSATYATINNRDVNNSNIKVDEKLKEAELNYSPPSKAKTVGMVLIFILIISFVIFLPDITSMVNKYKASKNEKVEEIITTGKLECRLKTNTSNLDVEYLKVFKFTDSKLESADYTTTSKGDIDLDADLLNEINDKCKILKEYTSKINGITVRCNYSGNKLIEKQSYIFQDFNKEEVETAFSEVGGTYPEYTVGSFINDIEKNMNASGYSCMRKK